MDYNKENKGFVCAVYNLMKKRAFFGALSLTALAFSAPFYGSDIFFPLIIACAALGLVCIMPQNFALRLGGFLISLAAIFVSLHKMNEAGSPMFYVTALFALFLFVMLISWFVYNARSSEVNEI